ncbi:MAG: cobalt-precorrin-5B (C(1))-methyltransferase CbiD [Cyanobacteria bacterium P01_H01_bin.130]
MSGAGYTLPVFAVVAAKAAIAHLFEIEKSPSEVQVDLLRGDGVVALPVEAVARLDGDTALAIARSDPGNNLDLTRDMAIWAWVQRRSRASDEPWLVLEGGEGIGRDGAGEAAIYRYARQVMDANLVDMVPQGWAVTVRIIFPTGRSLALRTSNAAFGIVDGLSLLGTSGIAEPHTALEKLEDAKNALRQVLEKDAEMPVVFCLGANGQQVAQRLGIDAGRVVLVGNWIGPLLVEAAILGAKTVHLLGYHGKLIKLAGGIFNTSSHIADGKFETLVAIALPLVDSKILQELMTLPTLNDAAKMLSGLGSAGEAVWAAVAEKAAVRSQGYAQKYGDRKIEVAVTLFDREGTILGRYPSQP